MTPSSPPERRRDRTDSTRADGSRGRIRRAARSLVAALLASVAGEAVAGEVTIARDTWGVPHVYAADFESAAYGLGYAQAEDRLRDVLAAYRVARGTAAEAFGPSMLDRDRVARLADHVGVARRRYHELPEGLRRGIEGFVRGVRDYMDAHPDEVPEWAPTPEPTDVVALYRAFAWTWPWGQARGDLRRAGSHVADGRGSNQWVVAASRSAEGGPIALIDPHLPWEPLTLFYELHLHGGDLDVFGFAIPGTPLPALGHTTTHSLSATTGGPDTADIYELTVDPNDPGRYRDGDRWRRFSTTVDTIAVRTGDGVTRRRVETERSHVGPVLARRDGVAHVARTAYDDEIGIAAQWYAMWLARGFAEFLDALRANQSLPQNLMYADVSGNTFYVRAGRVPIRPEGPYDWGRPVPWSEATAWLGIHPFESLVQMLNPPSGFMQNCNVSPSAMTPHSPLTPDRYAPEVYNSARRQNARGRRALRLLAPERAMTIDDARAIAMDTYVDGIDRWRAALHAVRADTVATVEATGGPTPEATRTLDAIDTLLAWNGRMDPGQQGATLYHGWMRRVRGEPHAAIARRVDSGTPLGDEDRLALAATLLEADDAARGEGPIRRAWAETFRLRRGDASWPLAGCRAAGISTLRSVRVSDPDEDGISWAVGGQVCPTLVVLEKGAVRSFSATPFGQSNHVDSPHFRDQAERLFSKGLLKSTEFRATGPDPTWTRNVLVYGKADAAPNPATNRRGSESSRSR